jgi:hypothetical protein
MLTEIVIIANWGKELRKEAIQRTDAATRQATWPAKSVRLSS